MRLINLSVFSLLLLLNSSAWAADGARMKEILVVNIQKVIDQSIIGKAARSDLQTELKKREGALAAKKSEIEKMKADLQKQATLLAGSALQERQDAIGKKERDLSQEYQAQRGEMGRKTDAQMKKLLTDIDAVLAEVVKGHDNAVIVESDPRLVVYFDPKLDLTDEVVKKLNDKKMNL